MPTLGDLLYNFYHNYIAPTEEQSKVGNQEYNVSEPYDGESVRSRIGTDELSLAECDRVAKQCPLFMKGNFKKSRDSTRAWFFLKHWNSGNKANETVEKIIWDFENRSNFQSKFTKAIENSNTYGNGYLIITFLKDTKGEKKLQSAPPKNAVPWDVRLLDSKHIKELVYVNKYYKDRHVMHFHYEDIANRKDYYIHPDRIVHVPGDTFSSEKLGKSKINLLRNTIRSKVNVDIATGEILSWFAHGMLDVSVPGLYENDDVKDKWEKILKEHPGGLVHDDTEVVKDIEPHAINPEKFYDWIVLNIAAALVMPTHVLTGIQTGRVTGSEIGFGDYYKDIKDNQDLVYTPVVTHLYKQLLRSKSKKWKYEIVWNPVYIDEQAEAEIMLKKALSIKHLKETETTDRNENRKIYNKGQIELDVDENEGISTNQRE